MLSLWKCYCNRHTELKPHTDGRPPNLDLHVTYMLPHPRGNKKLRTQTSYSPLPHPTTLACVWVCASKCERVCLGLDAWPAVPTRSSRVPPRAWWEGDARAASFFSGSTRTYTYTMTSSTVCHADALDIGRHSKCDQSNPASRQLL